MGKKVIKHACCMALVTPQRSVNSFKSILKITLHSGHTTKPAQVARENVEK